MIFNSRVRNAQKFAIKEHGDKKYGDEFPYAVHLMAVVSVLLRFGITEDILLCTAWLHDVLEDTPATYEQIDLFFGKVIADAVAALSEPKGGNRAWRHQQTYPRIRQNWRSLIVKLADRIANIEAGGKKMGMYQKEYDTFKITLLQTELPEEWNETAMSMWLHLDELVMNIPAALEEHKANSYLDVTQSS